MTKEVVSNYINVNFVPNGGQKITISEVWENRYRVNIWTEEPCSISHSFFIKVKDGEVVSCNPPITAA